MSIRSRFARLVMGDEIKRIERSFSAMRSKKFTKEQYKEEFGTTPFFVEVIWLCVFEWKGDQ